MKRSSWLLLAAGLVLLLIAITQIQVAAKGLEIHKIPDSHPPTTIVAPAGGSREARPVVLIGHGFAGSAKLMRGFSFSLAHAGYTTITWDFDGHGRNPEGLASGISSTTLLDNAESALAEGIATGVVTREGIAILGHSMGSGVALAYGVNHPETAATIAVSPVPRAVSRSQPRNLLLLAGKLEPRFVRNAEQLLAQAGGAGGDLSQGSARAMYVIPGVEHITILGSPSAHAEARAWLDAIFGKQPGAVETRDRRFIWYQVGILGAVLVGWALTPLFNETGTASSRLRPLWRRLLAPALGALGATLAFWLLERVGIKMAQPFDLMVGGFVLAWFGLAGLISLILLGFRLPRLSRRHLFGGAAAFLVLWGGVGLMGHLVWLPWLLIPKRLMLWPVGALLAFMWFAAIGETLRGEGLRGRILGWLVHTVLLTAGFMLSVSLLPELGVLILVLPVLPAILGMVELATARLHGSWPYAISGALFLSWTLLAVFPML